MKRFLGIVILITISGLVALLLKKQGLGSIIAAVRDAFRTG